LKVSAEGDDSENGGGAGQLFSIEVLDISREMDELINIKIYPPLSKPLKLHLALDAPILNFFPVGIEMKEEDIVIVIPVL
jgi:hypothetical protein